MQYEVPLPADYDMQIIRDRVRRTGHLMDGFGGLRFKAFLIREKAAGAAANVYAPFYVWDDVDGMRAFCWGEPGFSAIVRDFGRPPIRDWTVVDVVDGPARPDRARSLTATTLPMPEGVAPSQVVGELTRDFLAQPTDTTVHRVAAVDVGTWQVLLVELSTAEPAQRPGVATYEVLHVSTGAHENTARLP
jgi:hypothetical protein